MLHDVTVNIGIQLTLVLLINSREAAMSTKDDMIDKMGITHNGTKVHRMLQLHKTCQAMGSPSATSICIAIPVVMPAFSLRSSASITTGYSDGRPTGVFIVDSCLHAGYPNVCPPGANGDKTPCMRETPGGWPLSNPWYLPAKRAQRVQGQAPRVQQAIGSVAEGDPIAPVAM